MATMHAPWWLGPHYVWEFTKFFVPVCLSALALTIVLLDRRRGLVLRARKGDWYTVDFGRVDGEPGIVFRGLIEVYNTSNRANAIQDYRFFAKKSGPIREMISEHMYDDNGKEPSTVANVTPLTIAPYSGVEANVLGLLGGIEVGEMQIRIEVVDIHGRIFTMKVVATPGRLR